MRRSPATSFVAVALCVHPLKLNEPGLVFEPAGHTQHVRLPVEQSRDTVAGCQLGRLERPLRDLLRERDVPVCGS